MDITIFWAQFIHALCFVLGALMKQHTECCLNCSTVTEGPSGSVSLWFPCIRQAVQLGALAPVSFLYLDYSWMLMVGLEHPQGHFWLPVWEESSLFIEVLSDLWSTSIWGSGGTVWVWVKSFLLWVSVEFCLEAPGCRSLTKANDSEHLLGSFLSTSPRRYREGISFFSLGGGQHLRIGST